jgi:hypothetical protein
LVLNLFMYFPLIRGARMFSVLSVRRLVCFTSGFFIFLCAHLASRMGDFAKDPGVGWHIASGQWILKHGTVPWFDPFLAYKEPLPWISDQWGSDVIFALLYGSGGWVGLYNFLILVYLGAFFLLVYPVVKERSGSTLITLVATIFSSKPAEIHFILRPVIFGFFFMALLGRLLPLIGKESGLLLSRIGRWAFFLFFAWANLHPSFAYGLIILALYSFVAGGWDILAEGRKRCALRGATAVVAGAIGSLCTPYGWRLHQSILSLGSSKYFMRLHEEWMPLDILRSEGMFFILIVGTIMVATWIRAARGQRVVASGIAEAVILAFAARSGFAHLRMIPYFFILAAPLFGSSLLLVADISETKLARFVTGLRDRFRAREQFECQRASPTLLMALLFLVCLVGSIWERVAGFPTIERQVETEEVSKFGDLDRSMPIPLGPSHAEFPYQGLAYVKSLASEHTEALARKGSIVVLSPPEWGGFITLFGKGVVKPLFDDRNTMLGEERYASYFRAAASCGGLMALAQQLRADFLMIPSRGLTIGRCVPQIVEQGRAGGPHEGNVCTGTEPCWAQPLEPQLPNYADNVAFVYRVPPAQGVKPAR